jgi:hypothetical protein
MPFASLPVGPAGQKLALRLMQRAGATGRRG